jgi:predicted enzyme related to lactoylglutathione lyase
MKKRLGSFVWFEIVGRDVARARAFYGEVMGWKIQSIPMPGGEGVYEMFTLGEAPVAGLWPADKDGPAQWLHYLSVEDVDAATARVAAAGGTVIEPPSDIPGIGRAARIADPEGAQLYLFCSVTDDLPPQSGHGSFFWTELLCRQPAAMVAFYEKVAGFTHSEMTVDGRPYLVLERGGEQLAGVSVSTLAGHPPFWMTNVAVDDCDAAVARVRALGGTVYEGPSDTPGIGRFALVGDPGGAKLGLIKPAQP